MKIKAIIKDGWVEKIEVENEEKIIEILKERYKIHKARDFLEIFLKYVEGDLTVFEAEWLNANEEAKKFLESITEVID